MGLDITEIGKYVVAARLGPELSDLSIYGSGYDLDEVNERAEKIKEMSSDDIYIFKIIKKLK